MKRTILAVLMVALIATPCLAQEIEPDGLFSIEETLWAVCGIGIEDDFPFINVGCSEMGFYQGEAYSCNEGICSPLPYTYINSPVVSIAYYIYLSLFVSNVDLFIMQPSGFGVYTSTYWYFYPTCVFDCFGLGFTIGIMFKVADDWKPPEDEPPTE